VASAGGAGLLPGAPGTYGALVAAACYVAAALVVPEPARTIVIAAAFLGACAATIAIGPWAERHWNRRDPQQVVLDEVAGLFLVVLCYRVGSIWQVAIWGFLAARLFDILKPFPARRCERLPHGWGILLDDLASSVHAIALLYALAAVSGPLGVQAAFWPTSG